MQLRVTKRKVKIYWKVSFLAKVTQETPDFIKSEALRNFTSMNLDGLKFVRLTETFISTSPKLSGL